jgi:hypothetical protein
MCFWCQQSFLGFVMLVRRVVIFQFFLFISTSNSSIISDVTGGCSGSQCTGSSTVGAVMLQIGRCHGARLHHFNRLSGGSDDGTID